MGDQVKRWIAIPQDATGSQILFAGIRFTLAGILVVNVTARSGAVGMKNGG